MLLKISLISCFFLLNLVGISQLTVSQIGILPEPVSNNAQCSGHVNGTSYLYSFGGIDSTKTSQGIHLRSYRYHTGTGNVIQLPDLPDTLGKIAAAASRIGDTIYITGGYHVFQNGNEVSSNKIHRFNIVSNSFITDGPSIPHATDDHVQVVWRDSLLILITGWKNIGNIANVQIYNPSLNEWSVGTSVPNNHTYKSFGASGSIIGDTIYYFGGAKSSASFNIQNAVRKGVINPANPTQIDWFFEVIDPAIVGYRMAATKVGETLHWLGGSAVTYNYDGIAYNGSGGVEPINRDLYTNSNLSSWYSITVDELPMDLRGLADATDYVKYLAGGMLPDQKVTDKVYLLQWHSDFLSSPLPNKSEPLMLYPNPFDNKLNISTESQITEIDIYNIAGQLVWSKPIGNSKATIETDDFQTGIYLAVVKQTGNITHQKIVKR
ncbi:MAG: T9SS type A sorting domain-containing protein [Crocinitomicaceae bacterium]